MSGGACSFLRPSLSFLSLCFSLLPALFLLLFCFPSLSQFLCGCLAGGLSSALTSPLSQRQTDIVAQKPHRELGPTTGAQLKAALQWPRLRATLLPSSFAMPVMLTALSRGIQVGPTWWGQPPIEFVEFT